MNLSVHTQAIGAGARPEAAVEQSARRFARDGFIGPVRIFSDEECREIAAHLRYARHPQPAAWDKGRAVSDPFFHRLATHPGILSLITQVLGENIILWGANAINRKPGQIHLWHTDIESAERPGFASIWIGIENTSRESGLLFASRSHGFGKPIQQVTHEHGLRRDEVSSEAVLGWAREYDADATLEQPDVQDGEGLLFDGRIWHSSHNTRETGERVAILLQYAAADTPVRMPDFTHRWPFRFLETLPPAIVVRGKGRPGINRLVPAPVEPLQRPAISTWIHPLALPLPEDPQKGWKPYRIFRGSTGALQEMACHVSVLSPGHSPHPPHIHPEEEVLILLDGEAEIVFADDPQGTNARIERLRPGSFTYYPTDQHHTIRNASASPITYLMFKWLAAAATGVAQPLGGSVFHSGAITGPEDLKAKQYSLIFQQATAQLSKLHAHLTIMPPGAGYEPHSDLYDVAILVLSGKVETLGQVVEPHGLIYYSAGTEHGMKNVGGTSARYLVFEFHSSGPSYTTPQAAYATEKKDRFISTRKLRRALRNFVARLRG